MYQDGAGGGRGGGGGGGKGGGGQGGGLERFCKETPLFTPNVVFLPPPPPSTTTSPILIHLIFRFDVSILTLGMFST